jgi:phosphoribosylaminoimidazole-succinocarboxamide synthase
MTAPNNHLAAHIAGGSSRSHHAAIALRLPLVRRGKVRDVYELPPSSPGGPPRMLLVASDRISAFDVIMPTPIVGKGQLLTEIASWWFRFLEGRRIVATHLLSTDIAHVPNDCCDAGTLDDLRGRITIGAACQVLPIECVVRGYLEGSGLREYQATGAICGVRLPPGLRQCDRLPEPIFTPATKATEGHDENISFEQAADIVGLEMAAYVRDVSLRIYREAAAYARSRGIIIADTKFEFGVPIEEADKHGRVFTPPILIDEALTPDSSRFWPVDGFAPGQAQKSFDKQYLREYLETLVKSGAWDKTDPGPSLPEAVVDATLAKYREARDRLCG